MSKIDPSIEKLMKTPMGKRVGVKPKGWKAGDRVEQMFLYGEKEDASARAKALEHYPDSEIVSVQDIMPIAGMEDLFKEPTHDEPDQIM